MASYELKIGKIGTSQEEAILRVKEGAVKVGLVVIKEKWLRGGVIELTLALEQPEGKR